MLEAKSIYLTTPIYYVNAEPHLGHAYTTILTDTLIRFYRLHGLETFFLTGTDEHGDKVEKAARAAGVSPKEYADRVSNLFHDLWPELNISHSRFIRTTDENHKKVVRLILQKVYEKGDIYFSEYEGNYCYGCERFYLEKELVDGKCPDHKVAPEYIKENNYFFKMSKYQEWLIGHIKKNPSFIRPERYRNEILSFLKDPLEDLCISRPKSRLAWGIALPFDDNFVTYVWFDALINYLSGLGYPSGELFTKFWPSASHLIAKDILKPHAIYWPTMLKAAGIELFSHLNVHGYWNIEKDKMSKSMGNVVRPLDLKEKYGLDPFRYFLLRDMVFGLDSNFSEIALVNRLNSDLANDLGNLVSRAMAMAKKYFQGKIAAPNKDENGDDKLKEIAMGALGEINIFMEELATHKALKVIWELIGAVNRYIDHTAPWKLAKDPANKDRLQTVIYNILESIRILSVLITPFMPDTSQKIQSQLGYEGIHSTFLDIKKWGGLKPGTSVYKGEPLFPRIEK